MTAAPAGHVGRGRRAQLASSAITSASADGAAIQRCRVRRASLVAALGASFSDSAAASTQEGTAETADAAAPRAGVARGSGISGAVLSHADRAAAGRAGCGGARRNPAGARSSPRPAPSLAARRCRVARPSR